MEQEEHIEQEEHVEQEVQQPTASVAPTIVAKPVDHPLVFGKNVQGRVLEEVIETFIMKRGRDPPRIPLCKLVESCGTRH